MPHPDTGVDGSSEQQKTRRNGLQNSLSNPACFRVSLAVCRDLIFESTGKDFPLFGLCQTSWSPLPCRLQKHPRSLRSFFNAAA